MYAEIDARDGEHTHVCMIGFFMRQLLASFAHDA
jgi:hypothetical protein